ncbi:MAG TPA: hypothetical protein VN368_00935 [Candidatus Methylomirabilis sp.]|nr:hypothetical protein [Candidatus Methylomirabilis sp.]
MSLGELDECTAAKDTCISQDSDNSCMILAIAVLVIILIIFY